MNKYKIIARVVGIVYLAGFAVGLTGSGLIQSILGSPDRLPAVSANTMMLTVGAILWLMAVIGDGAHGVLMFPVLKKHSEPMAIGYLAARIVDAVFIAIMVIFILLQIPVGNEYLKAASSDNLYFQTLSNISVQASQYSYQIGMSALGVSGLILNYAFYKTRLIPRFLSVWGLVGYAVIFLGMLSETMGSGLGLVSSIPGGLWEVFMGVWLIVKGFNTSALDSRTVKTEL